MRRVLISFLHTIQEKGQLDTNYFLGNGLWVSVGQIISMAGSLVLGWEFANLVSKPVLGTYNFVLSVAVFLSLTSLPGIDTALVRSISRGSDASFYLAFRTKIRWGLAGSLISLLICILYWWLGNDVLAKSFAIVAMFIPLWNSGGLYDPLLRAKGEFPLLFILNFLTQTISVVLIGLTLFIVQDTLPILIVYFAVNTIPNMLILAWVARRFVTPKKRDDEIVSYGKHLSIMSVLQTITTSLDVPLIFHFLGSTDSAVYFIAMAAPEQVKGVFKNIAYLGLPRLSLYSENEIRKVITRHLWLITIASAASGIIYIMLAPYAFHLLFPKYPEAIFYSQILAISFFSFPLFLLSTVFQSLKKTKELYLITAIPALIQIVLVVVLIPTLGLLGAVVAKVLGRLFSFGYSLVLYYF